MSPEEFALRATSWQCFATLTFKKAEMRERDRVCMLFAWLRTAAKISRTHFLRLKWAVRPELGEQGGRFHYHAIIAGLAVGLCNEEGMLKLMAHWEALGGGFARCRTWDGRDAVSYILKDSGSDHSKAGANAYEIRKFRAKSRDPILAKSLLAIRRGSGEQAGQRASRTQDQRAK